MYLLPAVKSFKEITGSFELNRSCTIHCSSDLIDISHITGFLVSQLKMCTGLRLPVVSDLTPINSIILKSDRNKTNDESYTVMITEKSVEINGVSDCALFRGVTTFIQMVKCTGPVIPCCRISDSPDFRIRGLLHDTTRGKVPTIDSLKEIALQCAFYKINHLQLYIEHSYAFSMIPEFAVESDPLTSEEILDLDEFCKKHYIELVPALATFGHLYELLRIKRFSHLNELDIDASTLPHNLWDRMAHYTLNPGSEEGYQLIRSMIGEILPLFSSPFFNICADETFDLGSGKSHDIALNNGVGSVYAGFVNKILAIVIENGKTPMMWGDIILNHPEILPSFPEKTIFLNWGYGADVSSESTEKFAKENVTFCVCPGVMGWSRFANNINDASVNIRKMVSFGKQYGALGVVNTNWGDCGNVNFFSGSLHGIALGASLSWNTGLQLDDGQFDKAFSTIQWGEGYEKVGTLLRELGSCTWYHFGNVYGWIRNLTGLWNKEHDVEMLDMEQLNTSLKSARTIRDEFRMLYLDVNERPSNDLEEFIWSSSAIMWTCELLIFKKMHQSGRQLPIPVKKSYLIHHTFELIIEFKRLWRIKNKESELKNVVDVFSDVIKQLESM
jgi:hypothetical protein